MHDQKSIQVWHHYVCLTPKLRIQYTVRPSRPQELDEVKKYIDDAQASPFIVYLRLAAATAITAVYSEFSRMTISSVTSI